MMGERIKRLNLLRTRRVRNVSREGRQDDDERFSKKLAELRQEAEAHGRRDPTDSAEEGAPDDEAPPDADAGSIGRNLDLST